MCVRVGGGGDAVGAEHRDGGRDRINLGTENHGTIL